MQQIKNYLSQIQNVRSILLLASTEEFEELEAWLKHTKKGQKIYRQLPEDGDIDMIIFDVHYSKQLLSLPITECKYIIGKAEEEGDYFGTIVSFQVAYTVSIHKAQGLEFESVKIVVTDEVEELVTHNVFYTAITRAREKLKIYWPPEVEEKVINRIKPRDISKDVEILKNYIDKK